MKTQFDRITEGLRMLSATKSNVAYTYQAGLLVCVPSDVFISPAEHETLLNLGWKWCAEYAGYYFPLSSF